MDLSPPSLTRSPASSPNTTYSGSPRLEYPLLPSLLEPLYKTNSINEYHCAAVSLEHMDSENSLPRLDAVTSAEWKRSPAVNATGLSGVSNLLPADYEPFANYGSGLHAPYGHELYSSHPAQAPLLLSNAHTLASSSPRSPDPTPRQTFPYHPPLPQAVHAPPTHLTGSPIPRIKMENVTDYSSGGELSQYPSPRSAHALSAEPSSYGSNAGSSGYLSDVPSGSWPKSEYPPIVPNQLYAGMSASGAPLLPDRRQPFRGPRVQKRQPRKLTTKEEANFQCEVSGCGKLFSRSYNYKAHLETHDENREYPFLCTATDCDKKFVRKTDLQRHTQSVHVKEKSHKCDYCGRMFARKDTLRRHMEDGCSRRFDIGTLDVRGTEDSAEDSVGYGDSQPLQKSTAHLAASPTQLPPLNLTQYGPGNPTVPATLYSRR